MILLIAVPWLRMLSFSAGFYRILSRHDVYYCQRRRFMSIKARLTYDATAPVLELTFLKQVHCWELIGTNSLTRNRKKKQKSSQVFSSLQRDQESNDRAINILRNKVDLSELLGRDTGRERQTSKRQLRRKEVEA